MIVKGFRAFDTQMGSTSRSQVTITIGRSGQVVKRGGAVLDSTFSNSQSAVGSKRSVRDRGGGNVDVTLVNNKRQRGAVNRLSISDANGVDDMRLGKDDLRFKIMRKNVPKRNQSNGRTNGMDLREMLSRPARPSSTSFGIQQRLPEPRNGRQHMPEQKDVRQRMPELKDVRQRLPELKDVRHRMPELTSANILGRIPSTRSAYPLTQMDSFNNSYSPWTVDRLRRRSPDGVLGTSRGREGYLQARPLIRTYNDVRTVPFRNKDVLELSRPIGTASFMTNPALSAGPAKHSAPLLASSTPPARIVQKSSYTVDEQHTVEGLLHSLGLEKYVIMFKHEEVDMTALRQMRSSDLKELGIPMGPRKKILLALLSRSKPQF